MFEYRRFNVDATVTFARQAAVDYALRFTYLSSIKLKDELTTIEYPCNAEDGAQV
jgi:hypothetical protein